MEGGRFLHSALNSLRTHQRQLSYAALATLAVAAVAAVVWISLPLPATLSGPPAALSLEIQDRNGLLLRATRSSDGSHAQWVPYEQIDVDLINAFVTIEDRRFWEHSGVDWRAVARATNDNLRARHVVSGASTITMQLARLIQTSPRSWGGKFGQVLWALRLERHLTKQQILEQYLNRIELGQATVGVDRRIPTGEIAVTRAMLESRQRYCCQS